MSPLLSFSSDPDLQTLNYAAAHTTVELHTIKLLLHITSNPLSHQICLSFLKTLYPSVSACQACESAKSQTSQWSHETSTYSYPSFLPSAAELRTIAPGPFIPRHQSPLFPLANLMIFLGSVIGSQAEEHEVEYILQYLYLI